MSAEKYTVVETSGTDESFTSMTEADLKAYVSINVATTMLGLAYAQYVRRLVLEGKLVAVKIQEQNYQKWYVSRVSIEKYLTGNRRTSGLRRYILKVDEENETKVREALTALGVEFTLELNYTRKTE
jgi:hypothetical protein